MARGDITTFEEAKAYVRTDFAAADVIKCAILDNTATPIAAFATPALTDFTEVSAAGTYTAGGTSLGTWTSMISETGGVMKLDSATNPSWLKNASNDADAYWGLIYHVTSGKAIAFVDLGGPVDMVNDDLTINWPAGGIHTVT